QRLLDVIESGEPQTEYVIAPKAFAGSLDEALSASKRRGLEGIVAKRRTSTYRPGSRGRAWIKIKHERMQEVIVVGWREGKRAVASLLLGVPDDDGLVYVGAVGTGFNSADIDDFLHQFRRRQRKTSPVQHVPASAAKGAHWIRPDLVAEVAFSQWTAHNRLRHPRWRGWRYDNSAADAH